MEVLRGLPGSHPQLLPEQDTEGIVDSDGLGDVVPRLEGLRSDNGAVIGSEGGGS
jgi:hypothetical protein